MRASHTPLGSFVRSLTQSLRLYDIDIICVWLSCSASFNLNCASAGTARCLKTFSFMIVHKLITFIIWYITHWFIGLAGVHERIEVSHLLFFLKTIDPDRFTCTQFSSLVFILSHSSMMMSMPSLEALEPNDTHNRAYIFSCNLFTVLSFSWKISTQWNAHTVTNVFSVIISDALQRCWPIRVGFGTASGPNGKQKNLSQFSNQWATHFSSISYVCWREIAMQLIDLLIPLSHINYGCVIQFHCSTRFSIKREINEKLFKLHAHYSYFFSSAPHMMPLLSVCLLICPIFFWIYSSRLDLLSNSLSVCFLFRIFDHGYSVINRWNDVECFEWEDQMIKTHTHTFSWWWIVEKCQRQISIFFGRAKCHAAVAAGVSVVIDIHFAQIHCIFSSSHYSSPSTPYHITR